MINDYLPVHIYVKNADEEAKCEVENVLFVSNKGLKETDFALASAII
ncbi:hypothetical protein ACVWYG_003965 [Pedobacter sp. UYEF25]